MDLSCGQVDIRLNICFARWNVTQLTDMRQANEFQHANEPENTYNNDHTCRELENGTLTPVLKNDLDTRGHRNSFEIL